MRAHLATLKVARYSELLVIMSCSMRRSLSGVASLVSSSCNVLKYPEMGDAISY